MAINTLGDGYFGIIMGYVAWWVVIGLCVWWLIRVVRRAFWIGYGASEELGPGGVLKVWRFNHPFLSVAANFAEQTVHIRTKKAKWLDARDGGAGKSGEGATKITLPMHGFTYTSGSNKSTLLGSTTRSTTANAYGWVGGEFVSVSVPVSVTTTGESHYADDGTYSMNFSWRDDTNPAGKSDRYVSISIRVFSAYAHRFEAAWEKALSRMKSMPTAP